MRFYKYITEARIQKNAARIIRDKSGGALKRGTVSIDIEAKDEKTMEIVAKHMKGNGYGEGIWLDGESDKYPVMISWSVPSSEVKDFKGTFQQLKGKR